MSRPGFEKGTAAIKRSLTPLCILPEPVDTTKQILTPQTSLLADEPGLSEARGVSSG